MYGNLYVSGLVGSDATANPLPATSSTSSTIRTHNQPQPHLPLSTVATAALQNNRDDPHLAGNEACLCSLCHIKDRFFPRSQDGRIVLPHPTISNSTRLPRHTASMTSATPPPISALPTHRRNRTTDSTASTNHDPKFNEGRRGAGLRTSQSDKGEGSFTGIDRIPAIGESLPHRNRAIDESPHTPQMMDELEGRPFSGPSRRTQQSRKYDHKPKKKRPDPWPRIPESEEFSVQSSHLSQQSSSSQHTSSRTRLELFLDRHGTAAHPRNLLQTPLARELSLQTTRLEPPRPTTPLTAPQSYIGAYGYEHPSPHQGTLDVSMSNHLETPGRMETSQHQYPLHHHSASRPESLTDVAHDKTKIIKFSSRSKNPQSSDNNPTPTTSGERSVNSSPTRERPRPPSSHLLQSQIDEDNGGGGGGGGGGNQTQFRFQEPVVPEAHTTSPVNTWELSNVPVKWDSERKRRQGYFAQEEGAEKSPFRHYNKADCDFES